MTRTRYDYAKLMGDLVSSSLTITQIAAKHKMSRRHLQSLMSGRRRPAFKQQLDQMKRLADQETIRLGKALRQKMILDHYRMSKQSKGETGRKAREYLMSLFPPGPDLDDAGAGGGHPRNQELQKIRNQLRRQAGNSPHE